MPGDDEPDEGLLPALEGELELEDELELELLDCSDSGVLQPAMTDTSMLIINKLLIL